MPSFGFFGGGGGGGNSPSDGRHSLDSDPDPADAFVPPLSDRERVKVPASFVSDIFQGVLASETRCLHCETVTARDETFFDLSIDIEDNQSVSSCLRNFSAREKLKGADKFFCDTCRRLQEAERHIRLKRLPRTLALHLKVCHSLSLALSLALSLFFFFSLILSVWS